MGRVFSNGPVDLGSIPGRVIPKTLKMVLDTSFLNTQQYKVCIKGKVEKSRESSSAPPRHLGVLAIEKGDFWSPSTTVTNFTYLFFYQFHFSIFLSIYLSVCLSVLYISKMHGRIFLYIDVCVCVRMIVIDR